MSLARRQDPKLENLNFLTTYYAVEKEQSFQSVLQSSLNLLTDQLPKPSIDRLNTRLGDFFKDGKFNIGAFRHKAIVDQTMEDYSRILFTEGSGYFYLNEYYQGNS